MKDLVAELRYGPRYVHFFLVEDSFLNHPFSQVSVVIYSLAWKIPGSLRWL